MDCGCQGGEGGRGGEQQETPTTAPLTRVRGRRAPLSTPSGWRQTQRFPGTGISVVSIGKKRRDNYLHLAILQLTAVHVFLWEASVNPVLRHRTWTASYAGAGTAAIAQAAIEYGQVDGQTRPNRRFSQG